MLKRPPPFARSILQARNVALCLAVLRIAVLSAAAVLAGGPWTRTAAAADSRIKTKVDHSLVPPEARLDSGHYVTAREAHDAVQSRLARLLMIDVRTHGETLFNGVASPMHRHIPYVMLDIDHTYDAKAERYKLEPNPDFVKAVDQLLAEHKLDRTATLILYCTVGERSSKAANLLAASGFTNVYSMIDGFEGTPASRIGPGWKHSGLPWSSKLRPSQAYKSPSM